MANLIANNTMIQKVVVSKAGSTTGTRKQLNFIEGSNVTLTMSDNSGTDSVDITITSSSPSVPVTSVFGRIGAVVAANGDYNTSQVTENTNLYYTQGRFDSAFAAKSTTDLSEGTNLYFTNARVISALPSQAGNAGKVLSTNGSVLSWISDVGGVWGSITGTITDQTDLINYLDNGFVPYFGVNNDVNLGIHVLLDQAALTSINPNGRTLVDNTNNALLEWQSGVLFVSGSIVEAFNWQTGLFKDSSDVPTLQAYDRQAYDENNIASVLWNTRELWDDTGDFASIRWGSRQLRNAGGSQVLDWANLIAYDSVGNAKIDWSSMTSSSAALSFDYIGNSYFSSGLSNQGSIFLGAVDSLGGIIYFGNTTSAASIDATPWGMNLNSSLDTFIRNGPSGSTVISNAASGVGLGNLYVGTITDNNSSNVSINVKDRQLINSSGGEVADWNNGYLFNSGDTSLDWFNRQLKDVDGVTTVASWGGFGGFFVAPQLAADTIVNAGGGAGISVFNKLLIDSTSSNSVDWENRELLDSSGLATLDYQWGQLSSGNTLNLSADWWNRILIANDGMTTVLDWSSQELKNSTGANSLNWNTRIAINSNSFNTIDWENSQLREGIDGSLSIDWLARTCVTFLGVNSIDWQNFLTRDQDNTISIDWSSRLLVSFGGNNSMDWNNRQLYSAAGILSYSYDTGNILLAPNSTTVAVKIRGASGQVSELQRWEDSTGTSYSSVNNLGSFRPRAGSATANTSPIKFTSGPLLSSAEAGSMEFLSEAFYLTPTTTTGRFPIASDNNPIGMQVFS